MSESKHTPGPWFTTRPHLTTYVEARLRPGVLQEVASCGPTEIPEQSEANARLIAAAPELLQACTEVITAIDGRVHSSAALAAIDRCKEALTKAETQS